jgi:hypothetical protein
VKTLDEITFDPPVFLRGGGRAEFQARSELSLGGEIEHEPGGIHGFRGEGVVDEVDLLVVSLPLENRGYRPEGLRLRGQRGLGLGATDPHDNPVVAEGHPLGIPEVKQEALPGRSQVEAFPKDESEVLDQHILHVVSDNPPVRADMHGPLGSIQTAPWPEAKRRLKGGVPGQDQHRVSLAGVSLAKIRARGGVFAGPRGQERGRICKCRRKEEAQEDAGSSHGLGLGRQVLSRPKRPL